MQKKEILCGIAIALFLALFISPFASSWPDGLEKVAEDNGFISAAEVEAPLVSPMPDYAWPGISHEGTATAAAGAAGTLIVFGMGYGLAALLQKKTIQGFKKNTLNFD